MALNLDASIVAIHSVFDNRQAQAGASNLTHVAGAVKTLKQIRLVGHWNANTWSVTLSNNSPRCSVTEKRTGLAGSEYLNALDNRLSAMLRIRVQRGDHGAAQLFNEAAAKRRDGQGPGPELEWPRIVAAYDQHVFQQVHHAFDGHIDLFKRLAFAVDGDAVVVMLQKFHRAVDGGQGGTKLVRCHGYEAGLHVA